MGSSHGLPRHFHVQTNKAEGGHFLQRRFRFLHVCHTPQTLICDGRARAIKLPTSNGDDIREIDRLVKLVNNFNYQYLILEWSAMRSWEWWKEAEEIEC